MPPRRAIMVARRGRRSRRQAPSPSAGQEERAAEAAPVAPADRSSETAMRWPRPPQASGKFAAGAERGFRGATALAPHVEHRYAAGAGLAAPITLSGFHSYWGNEKPRCSKQSAPRVMLENLRVADVAPERVHALVA